MNKKKKMDFKKMSSVFKQHLTLMVFYSTEDKNHVLKK